MSAASERTLAAELGRVLTARGWRVATAESCTGGLVAGAMTAVPGSSEWFEGAFVAYSNEAKQSMLGVPPAVVAEHGAVSEVVARAMADGALMRAGARSDCAVAVTGVAGPGGGTEEKPVGTVCFAWRRRGGDVRATTVHLPGDRDDVRDASVKIAIQGLLDLVNRTL